MKPYYEQDGVTIYHGDCREVLARDPADRGQRPYDLLLTDPPYGLKQGQQRKRGGSGATVQKTGLLAGRARQHFGDYGADSEWDADADHVGVALARAVSRSQIIFGGNYYDLPPSSCWLVWDKDNGTTDFADCELAWTNLQRAVRKLTYRWNGMLQQPGMPHEHRQHPTQKPEPVMRWALLQAPPDVRTVLDPFMGTYIHDSLD